VQSYLFWDEMAFFDYLPFHFFIKWKSIIFVRYVIAEVAEVAEAADVDVQSGKTSFIIYVRASHIKKKLYNFVYFSWLLIGLTEKYTKLPLILYIVIQNLYIFQIVPQYFYLILSCCFKVRFEKYTNYCIFFDVLHSLKKYH
jgi:hypothetical protein